MEALSDYADVPPDTSSTIQSDYQSYQHQEQLPHHTDHLLIITQRLLTRFTNLAVCSANPATTIILHFDHVAPITLYYSPICPYSRMVWLFCLENKIPIELIKIDLLTPDHGVDPVYKKFKTTSPSLQVPLLVDGDFILEERYIAIPTD
jgi:hypothetical protein